VSSRADLLEIVAERIDSLRLPHPVRVAVDGPDAAGKTTIADELLGPLNDRGRTVIRAGIDGWHRPQAVRYRRGALSPEGYYYDSFDLKALRSLLLLPLGPGGDRRYVSAMFDSRLDSYRNEPWREAIHDAVLVFDGVFLLRPELNGCWDFRILLHADVDEVVRRVRERDGVIFGSAAAAEERYRRRYLPGQRIYFGSVRPWQHADVVVDNTDPTSPEVSDGEDVWS
jgi:uridine kinase